MDNINFLVNVLESAESYWCVEKIVDYRHHRQAVEKSIWLILIDESIQRPILRQNIKLTDLENLRRIEVTNIPLSEEYPPFQQGQTLYNMLYGFPITKDVKGFLIKALALPKESSIYDYEKLLEPIKELTVC